MKYREQPRFFIFQIFQQSCESADDVFNNVQTSALAGWTK
jgi:hypothetical protein